jgi:hypothetical protein
MEADKEARIRPDHKLKELNKLITQSLLAGTNKHLFRTATREGTTNLLDIYYMALK